MTAADRYRALAATNVPVHGPAVAAEARRALHELDRLTELLECRRDDLALWGEFGNTHVMLQGEGGDRRGQAQMLRRLARVFESEAGSVASVAAAKRRVQAFLDKWSELHPGGEPILMVSNFGLAPLKLLVDDLHTLIGARDGRT